MANEEKTMNILKDLINHNITLRDAYNELMEIMENG